MCDFPAGCGGLGTLHCTGCGGDLCICTCGGETECDGCDECEGAPESSPDSSSYRNAEDD